MDVPQPNDEASRISRTMASIRHLLRKHMPPPITGKEVTLKKQKDRIHKPPLSVEQIIQILEQLQFGFHPKQIAKQLNLSQMTVLNIKNRKRKFATLPEDLTQIHNWYEQHTPRRYAQFTNGHDHDHVGR